MALFKIVLTTYATCGIAALNLERVLSTTNRALWRGSRTVQGLIFGILCMGILYGPMAGIAAAPETTAVSNQVAVKVTTFTAVVTQYSFSDSCHYMRQGKCLMASGKPVYVGAAACPKFLDLGTVIAVDGKTYTCEDRYARWLDATRDYPTIDIFVTSRPQGNTARTVLVFSN